MLITRVKEWEGGRSLPQLFRQWRSNPDHVDLARNLRFKYKWKYLNRNRSTINVEAISCESWETPLLHLFCPLHWVSGSRHLWKRCSTFPLHQVALWGPASSWFALAGQTAIPPSLWCSIHWKGVSIILVDISTNILADQTSNPPQSLPTWGNLHESTEDIGQSVSPLFQSSRSSEWGLIPSSVPSGLYLSFLC